MPIDATYSLEEACAAADVPKRVLGPIAMSRVFAVPQVTDIVEQGGHDAESEAARPDGLQALTSCSWPSIRRAIASVTSSTCCRL